MGGQIDNAKATGAQPFLKMVDIFDVADMGVNEPLPLKLNLSLHYKLLLQVLPFIKLIYIN